MARADQPEDARCSCKTKFAVMTDKALIWGCDGCLEPLPLPYRVLAGGKEAIMPIWSMAGLSVSAALTAGCSCGTVYATTSSWEASRLHPLHALRNGDA